jgi:hypothetical protein
MENWKTTAFQKGVTEVLVLKNVFFDQFVARDGSNLSAVWLFSLYFWAFGRFVSTFSRASQWFQ